MKNMTTMFLKKINHFTPRLLVMGFCFGMISCATLSTSKVELPPYKEIKLANGLSILILEDRKLPLVSIGALVRVGAASDPLTKTGLTSLTGDLLQKGTRTLSANELADKIAGLGTSFDATTNFDFSYFSSGGLAENQDQIFQLFAEILTEPSFTASEVDRLRNQVVAQTKRSYDEPKYVTGLVFAQNLFGTHPYGKSAGGTVRDLKSIKQKDVIRHYLKYFRPNNTSMVLVGALDKAAVASLQARLEKWAAKPVETEALPAAPPISGRQILLVNRNDLKQSEVRLGHLGVARNNPDYLKLIVADTIFSDGFNSRLMREIRVQRGLTYGIMSDFEARKGVGPFVIGASTRHEKVGELVTETLNQMDLFVNKGISEAELKEAVGYLKGTFPRKIETADSIAWQIMALRFYGVNLDYLQNFVQNLSKLSVDDVNEAIRKYYHNKDIKIIVYAPEKQVIGQLRSVGAVTVKNYLEFL